MARTDILQLPISKSSGNHSHSLQQRWLFCWEYRLLRYGALRKQVNLRLSVMSRAGECSAKQMWKLMLLVSLPILRLSGLLPQKWGYAFLSREPLTAQPEGTVSTPPVTVSPLVAAISEAEQPLQHLSATPQVQNIFYPPASSPTPSYDILSSASPAAWLRRIPLIGGVFIGLTALLVAFFMLFPTGMGRLIGYHRVARLRWRSSLGTGATSFTTNGIIYGNGSGALQSTAAGTGGQIIVTGVSGVPIFVSMTGDASIGANGALTLAG